MRLLFKWLAITVIALVIFFIILIGLGYLLKTADEQNAATVLTNDCQQVYSKETVLTLAYQNNTCSFAR